MERGNQWWGEGDFAPSAGANPVQDWLDSEKIRIENWRNDQKNKPKNDDGRGFDSPLYDAGERLFSVLGPALMPYGKAIEQVRGFIKDNNNVPGVDALDAAVTNFEDWTEVLEGRSQIGLQRMHDAIEENTPIRLDDRGPAVGGAVASGILEEVATGAIPSTLGKIGKLPPPSAAPQLAPAVALTRSNTGNIKLKFDTPPSNVMQINAGKPGAFPEPGIKTTQLRGEGLQGRVTQLTELGKPLPSNPAQQRRINRAIWSTNYMISNPRAWARDATEAAKMGINWHHVGDLALTGDVGIALEGTDKFPKVMEILNKRFLKRTGNDSVNAALVPMGFDHQGLIHKKYYPKLESRMVLENAVKSDEIKKWSPKRIAGLLNVVLEDQQEIVIGWAKWKTDQIKKAYPELKTTAQIKEFVQNNGDLIRDVGKGEEILDVNKIRKYKAPKGTATGRNQSNAQIREIWGIQFGTQAAARGKAHTLPIESRIGPDNKVMK